MSDTFAVTVPASAAIESVLYPRAVLRGFTTRFDAFGRPERLEGIAKLNDDLRFLIKRVLQARALLKITLSEADLGNVAKLLQDEIEDAANWWPGQETPVSLSEVKITLRSVTALGGLEVQALEGDGDLLIRVGYVERSTGVIVTVDGEDALVVPFGAFFRRGQ